MGLQDAEENDKELKEYLNIYTPTTLLGVFSNAIKPSNGVTRIILVRGIYEFSKLNKDYYGYFYDNLYSQYENKYIKVKTPSFLRSKLSNKKTYIFKGYVDKSLKNSSIELLYVIDDIYKTEVKQIEEHELKGFNLLQRKAQYGYKDLQSRIKESVYKNENFRIANLYGLNSIVDIDFKKGLSNVIHKLEIDEYRCNFSSKNDLIENISDILSKEYNAIALVRGGGNESDLKIFNDPDLVEVLVNINPIVITAIGHTVDEHLTDKIADKKFNLPFDYGNSIKNWIEEAIEDREKSKSIFIEKVKNDLNKTYHDQIKSLEKIIETRNKEFENTQIKFNEIIENNKKEKINILNENTKLFNEKLKLKDDQLKQITSNNDKIIQAEISQYKAKYINQEQEIILLRKSLVSTSKKSNTLIWYIIIALTVGLLLGLLF